MIVAYTVWQLLNTNRYGEARSAYKEVQERHEDIKRIERTLTELAQLFNDVSRCWKHEELIQVLNGLDADEHYGRTTR